MISTAFVVIEFDLDVAVVVVIADIFDLQVQFRPARLFARDDHVGLVHDGERIILVRPPDLEERTRLEEVLLAQVDGAQLDDQVLLAGR